MTQEIETPKLSRLTIILIVLIIALVGAAAYLYLSKEKTEALKEEITQERFQLALDFQDLALDFDSIKTSNDTINDLLSVERERISQLLEEIKTIKSANAAKIREYKKELSSLRNVMRSFVVQIDSLNIRNEELTQENKQVRKRYTRIKDSYKELEEEKQGLEHKVEIASRLETYKIEATALNKKGKETTRTSRTEKIRICFTIAKNLTAPVGEKRVYLRLVRPDDELLIKSKDDLFEFESNQINYSSQRTIEYGGNNLDVCIYYETDEGELMQGTYTADIFSDGCNIGSVNFDLK